MKKLFSYLEIVVLIVLLWQIINRWNVTKISIGDFFCLELLAMLFWYEYDKIKTKNKK